MGIGMGAAAGGRRAGGGLTNFPESLEQNEGKSSGSLPCDATCGKLCATVE